MSVKSEKLLSRSYFVAAFGIFFGQMSVENFGNDHSFHSAAEKLSRQILSFHQTKQL